MNKKNHKQNYGVCKLTGIEGDLVKSHIIPQSVTRLSKTGEKYIETGIGHGVKKRATSWYDENLVTRTGEDILADIDSKAIGILRKHKLIWSGWEGQELVLTDDLIYSDSDENKPIVRMVNLAETESLYLFFLSIVWRAAASTRPELDDVNLDSVIMQDLKDRILNKKPGSFRDYPVQLHQIISKGLEHNRTPLLERKNIITPEGQSLGECNYVRIYFDGLVSHVHLPNNMKFPDAYLMTCIGDNARTYVFIKKLEESRTLNDFKVMSNHVHIPDLTKNILSKSTKPNK